MNTPRLARIGYRRYRIVEGPASGTILEASANPHALPCFRWTVVDGQYPAGIAGWTLRGLARACAEAAEAEVSA